MESLTGIFKIIFVSTCIIFSTAEKNYGQQSSFQFEHLQLPDGEQSNYITKVTQDSFGFMWFATRNGVYRYDGYSFTNYIHDPADPTSLSTNWVETLYIDGEGTLWLGTYGGLNRFNPENGTFTHFRNDPDNPSSISQDSVTVIREDHKGHLWVGTMGGLNRLDRSTDMFTRFMYNPDDPTSLGNDQVRVMCVDSKGTLWIGSNSPFADDRDNPGPGGLNRFNPETDNFTRYLHDPKDPNTIASNHVMSILEDSSGKFWVGTSKNGLHTMDRESGIFTRHVYDPGTPDKLSPPLSDPRIQWDGGVQFIFEDDQKAIWIGSYGFGLNRYDRGTGKLIRFEANPDDPSSMSSNNVWSMYQTQDGSHWIGMIPGGLNKVQSTKSLFEHYTLTPLLSSNFMNVLDVDNSGVLRVYTCCPQNTIVSFQHIENKNLSYKASTTYNPNEIFISAIEQTKDGTLWLASHGRGRFVRQGTLFQMDVETEAMIPVLGGATNTSIEYGPIVYIFEDSEGLLWFGTKWTGLFYMNRETGYIRQYMHNPENRGSLSHSNVTTIYEAPSLPGVIWIGTEGGGLNRFDKEKETFTHYRNFPGNPNSLNGDYITSIYEEAPGRLLIGTHKSGLNRFDVKNNTFTHFTSYNSGLSDNHVSCILGDKNGHIWLGTTKGLIRYDPDNLSFYTFGPRHGVHAFPYVSSCDCDQAGNLIFGGINGITVFNPDKNEPVSSPTPVILTSFILAGQSVGPEPEGPLQVPIWKSREIQLPHNENTFSFEFAALDYRDPQSNQYAYKLEGYDPDWRNAGTLNRADFTRIPHGEYIFRVRAANSEGVWNLEGTSIRITILSPWWRTWWAYFGYIFLFGGIIYTVYNFQLRQRLQREEALRIRELDAVKTKLYTNITHEFRTPLTVILGMVGQVMDNPDENLEKGMKMIERNGRNLLTLVNQLLDLSKLESNKLALHYHRADIVSFLEYIVDCFRTLAEKKDIQIHFIPATEEFTMEFDEVRMQQVVSNLISNAIKFTLKGGHIYVSVDTKNDRFILNIKDTGIGIAEADLPHIFDRFYQVDGSHTRHGEGTGIGLAITRELVKLMEGTITVKSYKSKGAEFEVVLPIRPVWGSEETANEKHFSPTKIRNQGPVIMDESSPLPINNKFSNGQNGLKDSPQVLIADDNEDVLAFIASCLKNDYIIETAKNGQECENMAFKMIPDLIVLDVMMPLKDGFNVCKTLKYNERTSHIPIIMLTAKSDLESKLEGLEQGADAYLTKPFEKKELLLRVRKLLDLRRQLQLHYRTSLEVSLSGNPPPNQKSPNITIESKVLINGNGENQSIPLANSLDHAFVIKVRKIIESHMEEPDFDVEKLCRFLALSHSQVHRKLSALTGLSATHYIRYVRLVKAREMILHSGYSISAIAYDCGFNDPAYFSRVFKQEFGVSPQVWREENSV